MLSLVTYLKITSRPASKPMLHIIFNTSIISTYQLCFQDVEQALATPQKDVSLVY